jgi:hypothetical protein
VTSADEPVLLVGAQRSGTTALAHALSASFSDRGGCFTVNGKLPYLLRRWWTREDAQARHLRADEVAHGLERLPAQGVGAEAWLARARRALADSAARVAGAGVASGVETEVRRVCSDAYNAAPWGDKYNEYLLDLRWLAHVWPNARWVFLGRDPHAVVASMLRWRRDKPWNPTSALAASEKWAAWNARWLDFRTELPPARRAELDYDRLCEGRAESLSELLDFEMSPYLTGFARVSDSVTDYELSESARAVARELNAAGICALRDPAGRP